ncbi:hypothetical protein A2U01_0048740, partial [Trifolium medium]|nr:hypothetical protein [Trifolium medium]
SLVLIMASSVPMGTYGNGSFPVEPVTDSSSGAQKATFKELEKKDYKALFIIHQRVSPDNFERVGDCRAAKNAIA